MSRRIKNAVDEFCKDHGIPKDNDVYFIIQKGKRYAGRQDVVDISEVLINFMKWLDVKSGRSDTKRKILFEKISKKKHVFDLQ